MAISLVAHQPIPHVERPMADPPRLQLARRRRSAAGPGGNEDSLMGVALLAGPANVIMELAMPGVGYGVLESRVESGRLDRHPIKRRAPPLPTLRWPLPAATTRRRPFVAR